MPHPSHRLDLLLLPPDPEATPRESIERLLQRMRRLDIIDATGRAGPQAGRWVEGGFRSVFVDQPGQVALYANVVGGFHVRCPRCGTNLVPTFNRALVAFRQGGPRRCVCPRCGADLALDELDFAPAAGFARLALVTVDVQRAALTEEAAALVAEELGAWRTVLRRP